MAVVEKPAASKASTAAKPLPCEHHAHHHGAAACLHDPPNLPVVRRCLASKMTGASTSPEASSRAMSSSRKRICAPKLIVRELPLILQHITHRDGLPPVRNQLLGRCDTAGAELLEAPWMRRLLRGHRLTLGLNQIAHRDAKDHGNLVKDLCGNINAAPLIQRNTPDGLANASRELSLREV